jgi:uncharacterized membrane protein
VRNLRLGRAWCGLLALGRTLGKRAVPGSSGGTGPSSIRQGAGPWLVLTGAMLAYAAFFGWWSLRKFDAFQAPGFDLGIFAQGLWLLSNFKSPFVTLLGLDLFGDHASYFLFLLVPLYWVWPAPEALLVAQTLALAVGAIPVFLLAKMVLRDPWVALAPAMAYLLMPALGWLNLENFHPDSFEVPLLLFALYFMAQSRWRPFLVTALLALTIKEDVFLLVLPLGAYVALRKNRRVGLVTCGVAVTYFVLAFFVLQPLLSGTAAGNLDAWRIPFGGVGGLLRTTFTAPWDIIAYMGTTEKLLYLLQLFAPVLFLPLLTARTLIILPVLLFNLISTFWYQTNLHYHYTSLIIPVLIAMAILALERFRRLRTRHLLAGGLLVATLVSIYLWGPYPGTKGAANLHDPQSPRALASAEAVALIPPDAVVASRDEFSAHLANRESVYTFPTPFAAEYWGDWSLKGQRLPMADTVEYVIELTSVQDEAEEALWAQLPEEGFVPIYDQDGVVVLKRVTPGCCP